MEKDLKKTVYWYTKAAEQGNADAQFNLGGHYLKGKGYGDYADLHGRFGMNSAAG